jgi:hypothetical protein
MEYDGDEEVITGPGFMVLVGNGFGPIDKSDDNFRLFAHSRTDLPAALDMLERAMALIRDNTDGHIGKGWNLCKFCGFYWTSSDDGPKHSDDCEGQALLREWETATQPQASTESAATSGEFLEAPGRKPMKTKGLL